MASNLTNVFKLNQMYELIVDDCVDCFSATPAVGELWVWGAQELHGVLGLSCADNTSDSKNQLFYRSLPSTLPGSSWYVCGIARTGPTNYTAAHVIKCDGTLWTWGSNINGQLGQNGGIDRSSPVQIPGTQWKRVASSSGCHVLAFKNDNTLWAWGENGNGELGVCDRVRRSSPVQIPGTQWCDIATNVYGSYGIKSDGTLWAWGEGGNGTLGLNDTALRTSSPVQIPGTQWCRIFTQFVSVAATKCDGTLWVWGDNANGRLGLNCTLSRSSPIQIPGTQWKCVAIAVNTLALKSDGTLWSWGLGGNGAVGDGFAVQRSSPIQIPGTQWRDIAVSFSGGRSYALKSDNTLWYWGDQECCAFGVSAADNVSSPVQLPGRQWADIVAYNQGVFAIENNIANTFDATLERGTRPNCPGVLYAWGQNCPWGELGFDDIQRRSSPTQIPGTQWQWCVVSPGTSTTFAIRCDCTLWGVGANRFSVFGVAGCFSSPVQIPGTAWSNVSLGIESINLRVSALKADGTLWMWGNGVSGALGTGDLTHRSSPVQIPGTQWSNIIMGCQHSLALKTDGTLWIWGDNANGQLGQNSTLNRSSPVQVPGVQWCNIAAGRYTSSAIKTDGTLWVWGEGTDGLVCSNRVSSSSPIQIPGTQWCRTTQAAQAIFAIKTDNTLWAWGINTVGQLGLNDRAHRSSPVQIPGTQWCGVSAGLAHALGIKKNGELYSWGCNQNAELGLRDTIHRSSPTQIPGTSWFKLMNSSGGASSFAFKLPLPF